MKIDFYEFIKSVVDQSMSECELNIGMTLKESVEKQIPKKPYKVKEKKQNEYYCIVCNRYFGDEMELKYACLQPEYCQHCGQAIDWSDVKWQRK